MKTRKKKQLTLYDVLIKNRRAEKDLRILRALVKEKKKRERWHQYYKVQSRTLTVGAALGICGALAAAGISRPFPRRNFQSIDFNGCTLK